MEITKIVRHSKRNGDPFYAVWVRSRSTNEWKLVTVGCDTLNHARCVARRMREVYRKTRTELMGRKCTPAYYDMMNSD